MDKYDKLIENLKELVNSLDEPTCIAMNIGEASIWIQNDLMKEEEQQFCSTVFHCMATSMANGLMKN